MITNQWSICPGLNVKIGYVNYCTSLVTLSTYKCMYNPQSIKDNWAWDTHNSSRFSQLAPGKWKERHGAKEAQKLWRERHEHGLTESFPHPKHSISPINNMKTLHLSWVCDWSVWARKWTEVLSSHITLVGRVASVQLETQRAVGMWGGLFRTLSF